VILIAAVKVAIAAGLMWWLFSTGRFQPAIYSAIVKDGNWVFLIGVIFAQLLMLIFPIIRWWVLLRAVDLPISFGEALRVSLMGAAANLFVPGGLGIDGVRIVHFRRKTDVVALTSTIVVDRLLGLLGLASLAFAFGLPILIDSDTDMGNRLLLTCAGVTLVLLVFTAMVLGVLPTRWLGFCRRIRLLDRFASALRGFRGKTTALGIGVLLSVLGHMCVGFAACAALAALVLPVHLAPVLAVTPLVTLAKSIPLSPMGIGISESAAALLYPLVGLEGGAEVALLMRATITVVFASCALTWLLPGTTMKSVRAARTPTNG
jgi:uncharacterized protein (TIRG00374 family)